MKNNRILFITVLIVILLIVFTGCAQETSDGQTADFDFDKDITVVARDAASGTRGAFHEIMNIIVKENDTEVDKLVVGALEFDGTDKVITAVEGDKYGIGYISLGSAIYSRHLGIPCYQFLFFALRAIFLFLFEKINRIIPIKKPPAP
jgi:phosphate transport system substrate-binding protein